MAFPFLVQVTPSMAFRLKVTVERAKVKLRGVGHPMLEVNTVLPYKQLEFSFAHHGSSKPQEIHLRRPASFA
jgi:hypothetical protein